MLSALETLLEAPLRSALGADVLLTIGPDSVPTADAKPQLTLCASRLTYRRNPADAGADNAPEDRREAAFQLRKVALKANAADPRRYDLPPGGGSVTEVQSPPGRLLALGDGYSIAPDHLRFMTAPTAGVVVTLRGDASRGYVERNPVLVGLDLGVWAPAATAASQLLGRALASILGNLAERDLIDLIGAGNLALRLLRPVARLGSLERGVAPVNAKPWNRVLARIELYADLEVSLTLGKPLPTSTIRQIQLGLDTPRADGSVKHGTGTIGGG